MLVIQHHVAMGIHGLGLFTLETLKKGQLVCNADYRMVKEIPEAEIASYPPIMQAYFQKYSYPGVGADALDGAVYYNMDDTRFVNHSEHPNLLYQPDSATYVAAQDIPAGTELTCDYADFCPRGAYCFNF